MLCLIVSSECVRILAACKHGFMEIKAGCNSLQNIYYMSSS